MDLSVCFVLFSSFLMHGVSKEMPPASLEVWPDSRQHFRGDQLSLHCSVNDGNSTGWMLKRLQGTEVKSGCLQLNGTASIDRPIECHFIDINSKNSGMYWCEGPAEDKRSKTINITVSYGEVILFSPVHPVMKGGTATLQCKSLLYKVSQTVFYKNGVNFLSLNGTEMTIENVTKADEGFYKCAFANSSLESSEIWLSVRENSTVDSQDEKPSTGSLVWVSGICIIFIILVLLPVLWLLFPGLREKFNVCPNGTSRVERFQQEMPKTKQDATEIQWDLPWMEMANLLDKQQHPCS
ncbi:uncharacterized protein LOC127653988 isoform X1 [Xyrauchen texanus]|uniref:uncharacterized protein LOC127653988 isoform X1 n=1 Tax=Xyrauchen texanus TaxID=154827 RepID=UPI00224231D1|nr:uncharacterized protein LOC127653988 isoform X1 [Xyrauchen texanus]